MKQLELKGFGKVSAFTPEIQMNWVKKTASMLFVFALLCFYLI